MQLFAKVDSSDVDFTDRMKPSLSRRASSRSDVDRKANPNQKFPRPACGPFFCSAREEANSLWTEYHLALNYLRQSGACNPATIASRRPERARERQS